MKIHVRIFAFIVLAGLSSSLLGQATSQIQGVIADATGAALPATEVKATQTETGLVRTVNSGPDGTYVFANLPTGPYRLEASRSGFAKYVQTGISLQVATSPTINITLQVGAVTTQVDVIAEATRVETQTPSFGALLENKRILELPLNGRNAVELIQLIGAAVPIGKAGTAGFPGGLNFAVAGGSVSGIGYQLDGTMYNNLFDAVNLPFPFPDALQEFKVETSTLTAQNGTHSAAAVSASVKSGTNSLHGSAFEFLRNAEMNARNFKATRRDTLKRNQFGGTLGGPIIGSKAFFFGGYQGTLTRSDPANLTAFVPTAAMLNGDFNQCSRITTPIRDPQGGGTFAGRQIPVTRFSAPSLAIQKKLPTSNDPCGQTSFGPVSKINEHQVLGRVDYNISDRQQIFGRYMATTYKLPPAFGFSNNLLDSATGGLDDLAQTWAVGHTYLISPTTVNSFRAAVNRVGVARKNDDYFSGCDIGVKMHCFVPHQTVVTVTGGFTIGTGTAIQATFIPTYYTLSDDVNIVRGSHQFAFGFSGFKYQHSQQANVFSAASFGFTGLATATTVPIADFMLGLIGNFTQGIPNTVFTNKWGYGLYGQDTWKVNRRLTVNYGLRWEPFLPQALNNGAVYNFDFERFKQGVRSKVFTKAPAGLLYAGDEGFQGKTGVNKRFNQFAPRVGIAFDPDGRGLTSIRASVGVSYDFPNIQIMSTPATAPPFGNFVTPPGPLPFADPYSTVTGGNPFPGTFGPDATFVRNGNYVAQQPDAKGPTTYTWNLSVQRQISDWLFSATYLGSQSVHIWVSKQLNPALVIPCPNGAALTTCNSTGNTNSRRMASLFNAAEGGGLAFVDQFESGGTSNYHGLILSASKRFARNFSVGLNYTWSHCIGDVSIGSLVGGTGGTYTDGNNRRRDRGNCNTPTLDPGTQTLDRRHLLNFSSAIATPRFGNRTARVLATGWQLSTSYRVISTSYLSVTSGTDVALTGAGGQRADQILANPLCATPNASCWLNPLAFKIQAPGTLGNSGRSSVPGPGNWGIDMALVRNFRMGDRFNLEARGEAFNVTNSYRAGPVTTGRNNAQFGQILTAQDPRIMQVALKLTF